MFPAVSVALKLVVPRHAIHETVAVKVLRGVGRGDGDKVTFDGAGSIDGVNGEVGLCIRIP